MVSGQPQQMEEAMSECNCLACGKTAKDALSMVSFADKADRPILLVRGGALVCICDECIVRAVQAMRESITEKIEKKHGELADKTKQLSAEIDRLNQRANVLAAFAKEVPTSTELIKE